MWFQMVQTNLSRQKAAGQSCIDACHGASTPMAASRILHPYERGDETPYRYSYNPNIRYNMLLL